MRAGGRPSGLHTPLLEQVTSPSSQLTAHCPRVGTPGPSPGRGLEESAMVGGPPCARARRTLLFTATGLGGPAGPGGTSLSGHAADSPRDGRSAGAGPHQWLLLR